MNDFDIDPRAGKYATVPNLAYAIEVATELIEEWDWEQDPHGYCHIRPIWIALVAAARGEAS